MSSMHDEFESSAEPYDYKAGKTPQTPEQRLARFREELESDIERQRRNWDPYTELLEEISRKVKEGFILGIAEAIIQQNCDKFYNDARNVTRIVEQAHNRAIRGTYLQKPEPPPNEYDFRSPVLQAEEPKVLSPREIFYKKFREIIGNERQALKGWSEPSNDQRTRVRALNFATNFPDGDPTIERIGTRILAWHNKLIKGEETNPIDANTARSLFATAKAALERAEKDTGYLTQAHVEQATPLIIDYIKGEVAKGGLTRPITNQLSWFINDFPKVTKQYSALDHLKGLAGSRILHDPNMEKCEEIIKAASEHVNEKIDAATAPQREPEHRPSLPRETPRPPFY